MPFNMKMHHFLSWRITHILVSVNGAFSSNVNLSLLSTMSWWLIWRLDYILIQLFIESCLSQHMELHRLSGCPGSKGRMIIKCGQPLPSKFHQQFQSPLLGSCTSNFITALSFVIFLLLFNLLHLF